MMCAVRGVSNKHKQNDILEKLYKLKTSTRFKKSNRSKKHNRLVQEPRVERERFLQKRKPQKVTPTSPYRIFSVGFGRPSTSPGLLRRRQFKFKLGGIQIQTGILQRVSL
jgi:hypothetical protein